MFVAKLGAQVTVCEQRSQEAFAGTSQKSYVIVLQKRGLDALKQAGISVQGTRENRYVPSNSGTIGSSSWGYPSRPSKYANLPFLKMPAVLRTIC
jgi:hypothetical protein